MMDAQCTDLNEAESRAAQKENVYLDGEGTVFHRWDQSSSGLSGKKVSGQDQLHITPSKPEEWVNSEPLTPTTNLKLLINAAIPDIRVREMRKILFGPLENENTEARLDKCSQFEAVDEEAGEFDQKPSRKQKSLGLLCQKFLALYPNNPSPSETISISLDEVATNLGVERRRIYDIVNVLESLKLVSRVAKNQYVWHGRRTLKRTLQELHALGQRQSYHLQMERAAHCNLGPSVQTERLPESCEDGDEDASLGPVGTRKDKSLRIMSQKFITLFLVSRTRVITLELAAKILIEEHQGTANHSKYKTKVRRLYDIANVLTSLDLIAKVHVKEERGRKPAFKWTGPMDFLRDRDVDTVAGLSPPEFHGAPRQTSQGTRPRLLSLSPFDIVPVPPQERVISVPGSPNRGVMGLMQEIVGASQKVEDGAAACHMQAGDGKRNQPYVYPKCGLLLSQAGSVHPEPSGSIPLDRLYSSSSPSSGPLLSLSPSPQGEVGESGPHVALPYFLGLSQAPVFMLCGGLAATEPGASPGSELKVGILGKRRTEDISGRPSKRDRKETVEASLEGDEDQAMQENSLKGYSPKPMTPGPALQPQAEMWSPPSPLSSHYLYVPNSAGFNSLNLLVSPGRVAGPLSLTSSAASSLAMPLVLLQFAGTRVGIPAHMVLRGHHVASPDSSPVPTQSSNRAQCQTPKEAAPTRSPAFFRTPGTLGCTEPRGSPRRVSAQRRLDVGQPAN